VVSGPVALDASALFESDWAFCGGQDQPLLSTSEPLDTPRPHGAMQLVPSGPDMSEDTFYNGILTAFGTARERIAIVTPYYVPDDVVQRALIVAALRGVRTQLIMPSRSNHPLADFARLGLLRELRAGGVDLRFYPHGMVHAKAIVVDDVFAYLGSPNLDMRSLFLNYEDALFMYDPAQTASVQAWIDQLLNRCTTTGPHQRREYWLLEQLARIVAPEL
jgi:cardiolipin synthase